MFAVPYLYRNNDIFQGPPIISDDIDYIEKFIQFVANPGYKITLNKDYTTIKSSRDLPQELPDKDKLPDSGSKFLTYHFIIEKFKEDTEVTSSFTDEVKKSYDKIKFETFLINEYEDIEEYDEETKETKKVKRQKRTINLDKVKKFENDLKVFNSYLVQVGMGEHFQFDFYPSHTKQLISRFTNSIDVESMEDLENEFELGVPIDKDTAFSCVTVLRQEIGKPLIPIGTYSLLGTYPKDIKWIGKAVLDVGKIDTSITYFNNTLELQSQELGSLSFFFHRHGKYKVIPDLDTKSEINAMVNSYFSNQVGNILR